MKLALVPDESVVEVSVENLHYCLVTVASEFVERELASRSAEDRAFYQEMQAWAYNMVKFLARYLNEK